MSFDFKLREFAYPLLLARRKLEFDRNQWLSAEALEQLQVAKLRRILQHANSNVPYYTKLFDRVGFNPNTFSSLEDLSAIPLLTKDLIRKHYLDLQARNLQRYKATPLSTSGTSGEPLSFLVDKESNIQEFVFYWRSWGWAGYRLGSRFAELSSEYFLNRGNIFRNKTCSYQPLTKRLLLNSLLLSRENVGQTHDVMVRNKPAFLKGLPSALGVLASLLRGAGLEPPRMKAIFSQGELLLQSQRSLIESVFGAPVIDSYGHLERTIAISQCEHGGYHIHSDYGLLEQLPQNETLGEHNPNVFGVVGTSLYNLAMPLIRYQTGDLVEGSDRSGSCPCGRAFPLVSGIRGRESDVIVTPDGRAITALYLVLDRTPGLIMGRIEQHDNKDLLIYFAAGKDTLREVEAALAANIRAFVGSAMSLRFIHCDVESLRDQQHRKLKVISSTVSLPT